MTTSLEFQNKNATNLNEFIYDSGHLANSQLLSVNLSIPIPPDTIIISQVELQELKKFQLTGVYWSMKDLEKRVNRKSEWIKENVLYPSRFRKILDAEMGGFVFYPKSKGQTWSFQATRMAKFLDDNFDRIFA